MDSVKRELKDNYVIMVVIRIKVNDLGLSIFNLDSIRKQQDV